jgi:hypothetical protein
MGTDRVGAGVLNPRAMGTRLGGKLALLAGGPQHDNAHSNAEWNANLVWGVAHKLQALKFGFSLALLLLAGKTAVQLLLLGVKLRHTLTLLVHACHTRNGWTG